MRFPSKRTVIAGLVFLTTILQTVASTQIDVPRERAARMVAVATLEHPEAGHLQFALASLWLNERVAEGNDRLRQWFQTGHRSEKPLAMLLERPEEYRDDLSRALGGVKWSARTWLRIYYLFSDGSPFFPGRLAPDVAEKLEELCWAYGREQSTLERADPKYIWAIQGSENHDMMDLSNAFLALQAIEDHPHYRERELRDGGTPLEHTAAWNDYYRLYARERVAYGLFVEIASPIYGKHFLGELFNLHDFGEDPALRRSIRMLLDVAWADWAVDQLGGVRGGGKTRAYFGHYAERGTSDSWYTMSNFLFERPTEAQLHWAARHGQVEFSIATSSYRLPEVVADLALDEKGRGEFEYISRRPGRMLRPEEVRDRPPLREGTWYHLDPKDSRLVRYSYCTPAYVLGSLWVDPSLGTESRLAPELDFPVAENYAAISSQSQWQGMVFPTHPNARVFPQCEGGESRERVNYAQQIAVQHKNVLLVQKHRRAKSAGAMRIYFAPGMKERLVERNGWLYLKEGDAFLAVGIARREDSGAVSSFRWKGDRWLYLDDDFSPVIFVAGTTGSHGDLEAFIASIQEHRSEFSGDEFSYSFADPDGHGTRLTLFVGEVQEAPRINGMPIDFAPVRVYNSPFLSADFGSPVVTIRKGDREIVHDFSALDDDGGGDEL